MTAGEAPQGVDIPAEQQQLSYMFVGEGISFTDEQRHALEQVASLFIAKDVRLVTVSPVEAEGLTVEPTEEEPLPVPVTEEIFESFAAQRGFAKGLASSAFFNLCRMWESDNAGLFLTKEPYPHIRVIDPDFFQGKTDRLGLNPVLDLRSIRERMIALPDPMYWKLGRVSRRPLIFLREFITAAFPDEPPIETQY